MGLFLLLTASHAWQEPLVPQGPLPAPPAAEGASLYLWLVSALRVKRANTLTSAAPACCAQWVLTVAQARIHAPRVAEAK